jgi:hypothetical protein
MPTARYSCRATSPNRQTSAVSPNAARPSGSGHCENWPAVTLAPSTYWKWCRGSVLTVTGMPRRVRSAISCSASFSAASDAGSPPRRVIMLVTLAPSMSARFAVVS